MFTEQLNAHSHHRLWRREVSALRDIRTLSGKLSVRDKAKAANRIEKQYFDGRRGMIMAKGGREILFVKEMSFKDSSAKTKFAAIIDELPEHVTKEVGLKEGRPDYVGWLLTTGRIPPDRLGVVAEAVAWEMADKSITEPKSSFASGVSALTVGMVKAISAETRPHESAWKFAISYAALNGIVEHTRGGIDLSILAARKGVVAFEKFDDSWVDNGSLMGHNLQAQRQIMAQVMLTGSIPDSDFMSDVIADMRPVPQMYQIGWVAK